jgi:hypothetical protein
VTLFPYTTLFRSEMVKKVGSLMYAGKDSGMNTIEQEIIDA